MDYLGLNIAKIPQEATVKKVLWGAIILGISCAFLQAGLNRSLWLDEGKLATNIITRDFSGLLLPLDSNQVAPIGFLLLEKLFTQIFGNHDYVLRFTPFIAYILTVVYAFKSSKLLTKSVVFALLATAILSLNYKLLYYSWEVKQYAVDVFIGLWVLYHSLKVIASPTTKRLILYAFIGIVSMWFSNISVIVLAAFGGYAIWILGIKQKNWRVFFPYIFWMLSFGVYYFLFVKNHPINQEATMLDFWEYGFLPLNPFSFEFYSYFAHIIKDICYFIMEGYVFMVIPAVFIAVGIVKAIKARAYGLLYVLIAPTCIHLVLSGLRLYPMRDRLLLYLIPFAIFFMTYGIIVAVKFLFRKYKVSPLVIMTPIVGILLFIFLKKYPFHVEEVRDSIQHIAEEIAPSETLYVYGSAIDVFNFYSYENPKFENRKVVRGTYLKLTPEKYVPEIESIGGTVWILFAHSFTENNDFDEEDYILEGLEANGHEILSIKKHDGSTAVKLLLE